MNVWPCHLVMHFLPTSISSTLYISVQYNFKMILTHIYIIYAGSTIIIDIFLLWRSWSSSLYAYDYQRHEQPSDEDFIFTFKFGETRPWMFDTIVFESKTCNYVSVQYLFFEECVQYLLLQLNGFNIHFIWIIFSSCFLENYYN